MREHRREPDGEKPPRGWRFWKLRLAALGLLIGWLVLAGIGGPMVGRLAEVQKNDNASFLPAEAESTTVNQEAAKFVEGGTLPYFVVITRESGITPADQARVREFVSTVPRLGLRGSADEGAHQGEGEAAARSIGDYLTAMPTAAVPSKDRKALLLVVRIDGDRASEVVSNGETVLFAVADAMRTEIDRSLEPAGLIALVTGPGGVYADFVIAFGGLDTILIGVALGVVFLILLIVYRTPLLPLAVLSTSVFGLALAALVIYPLARHDHLTLNGQSQGILSILVVGAATDYSLLLVARYKEELGDRRSRYRPMWIAWRAVLAPVAASAATVILGLMCLLLSQLGSTRGLGPIGAIGIAAAFLAAMTFLPAILLLFGRAIFWPHIPRLTVRASDRVGGHQLWARVAEVVGRRPRRVWLACTLGLLACGAFLPTLRAEGTSQADLFTSQVESVTGQRVLARYFPAGFGAPVYIIAPADRAPQVIQAATGVAGIASAAASADPRVPPKVVEGKVLVQALLTPAADSPEATQVVRQLRAALDPVSPEALVGGTTAANVDILASTDRDLKVIIPAILAVIFVVLLLLLRSVLAAGLLIAANVISFGATLGVSAVVFNHVFRFPGTDPANPLFAFVFLVALGVDYSIFLMTRVREEARQHGSRRGILAGLTMTGGVITSAGVVLAATFSALAVLPILFLIQLAFMVGFGILLDTMVVRSLLVPAVAYDIGRKVWWPGRIAP